MADNFNRTAMPGPLLLNTSSTSSTILETSVRADATDSDANPYSSAGYATRYDLLKASAIGADLTTSKVGGMLVALGPFVNLNLTTNMAGTVHDLAAISGAEDTFTVPRTGSIIGVSCSVSTHITAGTVSVRVTVNGTTKFTSVNAATSVLQWSTTQAKDTDLLAAGDRVGCLITTSASLTPANNDLTSFIWIEQ